MTFLARVQSLERSRLAPLGSVFFPACGLCPTTHSGHNRAGHWRDTVAQVSHRASHSGPSEGGRLWRCDRFASAGRWNFDERRHSEPSD